VGACDDTSPAGEAVVEAPSSTASTTTASTTITTTSTTIAGDAGHPSHQERTVRGIDVSLTVSTASPLLDRVIARFAMEDIVSPEPRCRPTESYVAELRRDGRVVSVLEQVLFTHQSEPLLMSLGGRRLLDDDGSARASAVVRALDPSVARVRLLERGEVVDEADIVSGYAVLVGDPVPASVPYEAPALTVVGFDRSGAPNTQPTGGASGLPSGCTRH
jgi:hypothetical protein